MPGSQRSESLKAAFYDQIARVGRATASPSRLELLDLLAQGARTVEALAAAAGRSVAATSHHLQILRRARLVQARKSGLYVTYALADAQVSAFLVGLRRLASARLGELEAVTREFLEARSTLESISDDELARRVRAGTVTVIDVRPREEYAAGHIPGAISLPLGELKRRVPPLPRGRDIVAYCRGPYCVMALDAVDLLRRRGFRAYRMERGVPDWRASGWRVERGGAREAAAAR